MIGEICKYLDRDVYEVFLAYFSYSGNICQEERYHFYSYDKAYKRVKELLFKHLSIEDMVNIIADWVHDNLYYKDIELFQKIMESGNTIKKSKKHCSTYLLEACEKVLEKNEQELIEMTGYIDTVINRKERLGNYRIGLEKLTIES